MEEDLRTFLLGGAAVSAIVGERLAWGARPQGELLPCGTLHRITGGRDYHMRGRSGLVDSLVQIDCWAGTWLAAKELARAVVARLDGLTEGSFQKAFVESERDSFEAGEGPQPGGTTDFYRTSLDVRIWHVEAA